METVAERPKSKHHHCLFTSREAFSQSGPVNISSVGQPAEMFSLPSACILFVEDSRFLFSHERNEYRRLPT